MADIHRLPHIAEVEEEASEWIARLRADDVSTEDRTRFEAWLHSRPLHARTYAQLLDTWHELAQSSALTRATGEDQALDRPSALPGRGAWRQWALAVSGLVMAVWVGFQLFSLTSNTTLQTALGERATVTLPDGSKVQLNSDSRVRVHYSLRSRVISLERGEAFFEVAHNVGRPFWVTTGSNWVRAVGTAFNVYQNRKGLQVTVHEGTVKVGSGARLLPTVLSEDTLKKASAVLNAGEQAELAGSVTTTRKLSPDELTRAAAWQSGWLFVEKSPLCDVIAEINRYTPRRLVLRDSRLCSLTVGGAFQANPQGAEALLVMLENKFGARVERDGEHAYIEGATDSSARM
jgi:transmembrane sensor